MNIGMGLFSDELGSIKLRTATYRPIGVGGIWFVIRRGGCYWRSDGGLHYFLNSYDLLTNYGLLVVDRGWGRGYGTCLGLRVGYVRDIEGGGEEVWADLVYWRGSGGGESGVVMAPILSFYCFRSD